MSWKPAHLPQTERRIQDYEKASKEPTQTCEHMFRLPFVASLPSSNSIEVETQVVAASLVVLYFSLRRLSKQAPSCVSGEAAKSNNGQQASIPIKSLSLSLNQSDTCGSIRARSTSAEKEKKQVACVFVRARSRFAHIFNSMQAGRPPHHRDQLNRPSSTSFLEPQQASTVDFDRLGNDSIGGAKVKLSL